MAPNTHQEKGFQGGAEETLSSGKKKYCTLRCAPKRFPFTASIQLLNTLDHSSFLFLG
jgi:hypothetical protein